MSIFPPAPPEEEGRDAHCETCGSLFHGTVDHSAIPTARAWDRGMRVYQDDFPPGYDPAEADRLIGRDPHGA